MGSPRVLLPPLLIINTDFTARVTVPLWRFILLFCFTRGHWFIVPALVLRLLGIITSPCWGIAMLNHSGKQIIAAPHHPARRHLGYNRDKPWVQLPQTNGICFYFPRRFRLCPRPPAAKRRDRSDTAAAAPQHAGFADPCTQLAKESMRNAHLTLI